MEWNQEKTIDFINDYQKRPLLWQTTHINYKNRDKRKDAVTELAVLYGLDYKGVLNKIKSLRSYFHREDFNLKKKTKSGMSLECLPHSSWFAYKHLQFISGEEAGDETGKDTIGLDTSVTEIEIDVDLDGGLSSSGQYNEEEDLIIEADHIQTPLRLPTNKRKKQIETEKEETLTAEACSYLKTIRDEASVFGELVAHKIRALPKEMDESTGKQRDIELLRKGYMKLVEQEVQVTKALQAVKLEIQKNDIEWMEVENKIRELKEYDKSQQGSPREEPQHKMNSVNAGSSGGANDIDNPSVVNQTKLDLSIFQKLNVDGEEESEDSD